MNTSSSFEISNELLEKSFKEYENSHSEDCEDLDLCSLSVNERNPVKKKVKELNELQAKSKLSTRTLQKIIPILNSTPGATVEIPNSKRFLKANTEKLFEQKYYAKCVFCNELNLCGGPCNKCSRIVSKNRNNYFVYLPIEPQIKKSLIQHFDEINEYLDRPNREFFTDIDDGEVQKSVTQRHPMQKILSFTLNIDGGKIAEKSTKSIWPIQLYQNFLPPHIRFRPENILVAGLYYDEGKPNPFELLFPLLRDFNNFYNNGMQLIYNGLKYDFLPMLIHGSFDLPARAICQNFKLYSGTDACPICLHNGERVVEKKQTRIRYTKQEKPSEIRTHIQTVAFARAPGIVHGVKGMSCLMALPEFDIIKGISTDYMHNVLLGSFKRLLSIWLGDLKLNNSTFKAMSKQKQEILNQRITSLKPYCSITYKPRSLQHRSLFRAIEYKYLLFYYLRFGLSNLLAKKYIDHFELLSASVYILCKDEINGTDIEIADNMLNKFCDQFEIFFGKSAVTMNIHLLRHYAFVVKNLGPLWSHSVFGFESNMGVLSRYYSGGADAMEQISTKYINAISINTKISCESKPIFSFHKNFPNKYDNILHENKLDSIDGKISQITLGKIHYKSLFSKETKSIDFFFLMKDNTIGVAVYYVKKQSDIFILLQRYKEVNRYFHLIEVCSTDNYAVFPLSDIKTKLLYLRFGTIEIVTNEPNKYEKT